MPKTRPRGIAVVDVGYTNCKVMLYESDLTLRAERKITSPHRDGEHYREIDVAPIIAFAKAALVELDQILPIDTIVPCAHGACIVSLKQDGSLAVPIMDYMSEPPPDVLAAYTKICPRFDETYSPLLPVALLHAMQLFWQQSVLPLAFAQTKTILPLMQFVAFALGGRRATEVSAMSCQSHLVDMRNGEASSLSKRQGWAPLFAEPAMAWEMLGRFSGALRGDGNILAGVHDSNANFLRYLASGADHFTLLSTGTWIIGFDTDANISELDHRRDIVANKTVFGKTLACGRFFGGREFEILASGAMGDHADIATVAALIAKNIMALPSFSDTGGPLPGTGGKGQIRGLLKTPAERASLASLYCALMASEMLDALLSTHDIIVDGPFSQNEAFLQCLATLRPNQKVKASEASEGTASGAACLALMPLGKLPHMAVGMRTIKPARLDALQNYQKAWQKAAS